MEPNIPPAGSTVWRLRWMMSTGPVSNYCLDLRGTVLSEPQDGKVEICWEYDWGTETERTDVDMFRHDAGPHRVTTGPFDEWSEGAVKAIAPNGTKLCVIECRERGHVWEIPIWRDGDTICEAISFCARSGLSRLTPDQLRWCYEEQTQYRKARAEAFRTGRFALGVVEEAAREAASCKTGTP